MSEMENELDIQNDDVTQEKEDNKQENFKAFVFDWLEVLVHAIIVVVICFSFLFRIATIDGPSMKDTLHHGERVIISNLFYEPKVGDIVVISRNKENSVYTMNDTNTPIIKRPLITFYCVYQVLLGKLQEYLKEFLYSCLLPCHHLL